MVRLQEKYTYVVHLYNHGNRFAFKTIDYNRAFLIKKINSQFPGATIESIEGGWKPPKERRCLYCGKSLPKYRSKYCSDEHRKLAYRNKREVQSYYKRKYNN